jgi:hypothetical protein
MQKSLEHLILLDLEIDFVLESRPNFVNCFVIFGYLIQTIKNLVRKADPINQPYLILKLEFVYLSLCELIFSKIISSLHPPILEFNYSIFK